MRIGGWASALCAAWLGVAAVRAEPNDVPRIVEVEFTPVARAQIAVWLERPNGDFLRTLALTQATSVHGLGNRPGASQINSGFRWPYGRREGVLPTWAHRRAAAPGARRFPRVIFQDRRSEGFCSRTSSDYSRDDYYCLAFDRNSSGRENLDAVTCPSIFNSDKGRYLTDQDLDRAYAEPMEAPAGRGAMRPLSLFSLYPPRQDLRARCSQTGCFDHPDVARYRNDARAVMPEIDAVTIATPAEAQRTRISFSAPPDWPDGEYLAWVEVHTEGDYNRTWGPETYPTPKNPDGAWDSWCMTYGYPYRGQPSVVFRVPFQLGHRTASASASMPHGYGSLDGASDALSLMDGSISADAPGSGVDRLQLSPGAGRVRVNVFGSELCVGNRAPTPIGGFEVTAYEEPSQAHRFAHLRFVAPRDDLGVDRYEVRVSQEPIVDQASWERARPARAAVLEIEALSISPAAEAGDVVEADFGGLVGQQTYFVGIRAYDRCNAASETAVSQFTTPEVQFTTVSPCFIATAAFGTPMADEVGALRRYRDRHLMNHPVGRLLVDTYYRWAPPLAAWLRGHPTAKAVVRAGLAPLIDLVSWRR